MTIVNRNASASEGFAPNPQRRSAPGPPRRTTVRQQTSLSSPHQHFVDPPLHAPKRREHCKKLFKKKTCIGYKKVLCLQTESWINGMVSQQFHGMRTTLSNFKTKIKLHLEPEKQT